MPLIIATCGDIMQFNALLVKPVYIVLIIALIIIVAAVVYFTLGSGIASGPVVAAGDNISVYYTGTFTNGTIFDTNVGKQPLQFTAGTGEVISGFDDAVIGMRLNESKTVTIPPNQAYGTINPNLIVQVPLSSFGNNTVSVGMAVTQTSNGQQFQGTITAISANTATVDFNPPLAGKTLIFNITVVGITKPQ